MPTLNVVNIKCGGCEASIISALAKAGLKNIKVDVAGQQVSFSGDAGIAKKVLTKIGYPEAGSTAAKSLLKKAKSFSSCLVGRIKK